MPQGTCNRGQYAKCRQDDCGNIDQQRCDKDITRKSVPDGCYAVTAQDTE